MTLLTETRPGDDAPARGHLEDDLDHLAVAEAEPGPAEPTGTSLRLAAAICLPTLASAVMVGGVFIGAGGRIFAAVAGLLGVALAVGASRLARPALANVAVAGGLFAIGLVLLATAGPGGIFELRALVADAASSGDLLRPPVPFDPGWKAIIGWLMGIVGFAAGWLAIVVRRPALGLLVPMPIAAFAGISVPDSQQVASGLAVLVLFAIGLGLLSSEQAVGEGDQRPPVAYEVRKAIKALPVIAVVTVGLYFMAQADFLFPAPVIDPAQEPQAPKTVPLSEVEDRVLFSVSDTGLSGPWRIGALDVYDVDDGTWKLPAFTDSELDDLPDDGFVDRRLAVAVEATFTVQGLGGAVLPGLPNTVGITADGPQLAYDARSGNIRVDQGQVDPGLTYTVAAAGLPTLDELRQTTAGIPEDIRDTFLTAPDPPPAAAALIAEAEADFDNRWDRFDFLRTYVLDEVVAAGPGSPVPIPAERVQEILTDLEGSPFEIVALQGLFARWVEVPSRLGYGFDGGDAVDGGLEIRPRNGATFPEVYFEGFGWLPVIGTPKQAEPTVGGEAGDRQSDPTIVPSDDIAVQLFLPLLVEPDSVLAEQLLLLALALAAAAVIGLTAYTLWPAARKAWLRGRRRNAALAAGPRARLALAYAEWRDHATDLGYRFSNDTPLAYCERFVDDEEHEELAWLVSRGLWGDLQHRLTPELAATAEELSRALRRRLSASQPATMRAVAAVSRLSLRQPFAPDTDLTRPSGLDSAGPAVARSWTRPWRLVHKERARVAPAPI